MEHTENAITLRGQLTGLPEFSHENHGKRFCRFLLEVRRLSGAADLLPVVAEEALVHALDPSAGDMIAVTGQIRSHNRRENGVRRLMIFVFATQVNVESGEAINDLDLTGILCREPVYRRTPLGREICDVMLAVPRAFHRADYIPCILWGRLAQEARDHHVRDLLSIRGRLQSRIYTKLTPDGATERTAYEVSALEAWFPEPVE